MDEVILEGVWERDEFLYAMRKAVRIDGSDVIVCAIPLIFCLLSLWFFLVLGLLIAMMIVVKYVILPVRIWNNGFGIQEPRRSVISDEGFTITAPSFSIKLDWSRFDRANEDSEFYFLIPKKGPTTSIFRKRTFATDDDQARFRVFLRRHMKSELKLDPHLDALVDQGDSGL